MKLLYYSPHPHLSFHAPTGYGTHMREMVAAFRKEGVEVKTLIAGDLHASPNVENHTLPTRSGNRWLRSFRPMVPAVIWESIKDVKLLHFDGRMERLLRRAIADFKPDVVYERVAYLQNSGIRVCSKLRINHIAEINAPYPEEREYFSGRSYLLGAAQTNFRQVLIQSNLIVTVSSALSAYFVRIADEAADKTIVQPNAISLKEVKHSAESIEKLREELRLKNCIIFGFVGSIFPYHGVDVLIRAFAKLAKSPPSKLLIVGDGESLPQLKSLAKQLGVLHRVVFTGSVPHRDVYLYIELMDICCMAKSNWYGSPVKIFEYGLLKKAVIAPDVAPVRDVMDEETGVLVKPEVEAVEEAMKMLLSDETYRRKRAEKWHHKVLTQHTWERAAKRILQRCT